MPVNNMSVGKDLSFTLVSAAGTLEISGLTSYSSKKKNNIITSKRLTGKQIHGVIPDGWEITITFDRTNAVVDRFFAARDADYYAGVNIVNGTIYEQIKESDGSTSFFRYTEVALALESAGDWKGDAYIPITLMAYATERLAA